MEDRIRAILESNQVEKVLAIPLARTGSPDMLVWHYEGS
ncbi:hypothetical protein Golax_009494, partial [Gossypium laxum]|nr:hypothetical protein [Gossypium laxum]